MKKTRFQFDIRALRAEGFEQVLPLIAVSAVQFPSGSARSGKSRCGSRQASASDGARDSGGDKPNQLEPIARNLFAENKEAIDFFGFSLRRSDCESALKQLDGMPGRPGPVVTDTGSFTELSRCWGQQQGRLAEREFRVWAAVLGKLGTDQSFAPICRDEIRIGARGYLFKQEYLESGRDEPLLTDMQIRVTLDKLQARGLFSSVVYGNRHRYFSGFLSPEQLAEQVRRLHSARANAKPLKISRV